MKSVIGVMIENRYFVELIKLDGRTDGLLKLTTLKAGQRRATVKIYCIKGPLKREITEFSLQNLDRGSLRNPALDLRAGYNGGFRLDLEMLVNGTSFERRTLSLIPHLPGRFILGRILPAVLLSALIILFFTLFLPDIHGRNNGPSTAAPRPSAERDRTVELPSRPAETPERPQIQPRDDSPSLREESPASVGDATPLSGNLREQGTTDRTVQEVPRKETPAYGAFESVTIYFNPDEAVVTPEGREALRPLAAVLTQYPGKVIIAGHCASYGTENGRQDLSLKRAQAIMDTLSDLGWKPKQTPELIGYGSTLPATRDSEAQHLNRRVEIIPGRE